MKSLAPNTLLQNRYLVVHLIGKGGMGEVYLAVDQRLGSAIALKRTLHGDNAQLGDAFEREARTLARLRHPALPKVSDHFLENDNQYLVMEHISGDDLAKRLNTTQKPFPLSWVLFWADQLLDALAYLHTHEPPIVHRDIKPQNLKLTDDNNIVLLDFGLSKNSVGQTISQANGGGSTGSVVGYTPHYAPMEQIRGTGTNPKSDIYSLSATLYQLLTNIVPPDALSRADFLLSGKTDPIAPINEVNSEIPKSISDVILKGMSISQDQRFSDAREMQKILRETYAKMQSAAADKTIAFNVQEDEQPAPSAAQSSPSSNDKTEQFSMPPVLGNQPASKEAMGAQTIPFGMMQDTAVETPPPTASQNADKTEQIPNFDQTLRIDDVPNVSAAQVPGQKTEILPVADSTAPQSNVKTEVFGGDFGAAEYLEKNENATTPPQNFVTDDFSAKTDENIVPTPSNFTGDKTVPFIEANKPNTDIDLAQTQYPSAFDSVPQAENFGTAAETRLPTEGFSQTNEQAIPQTAPNYDSKPKQWQAQPVPAQPQPEKKKSKGLLFGILGALFGLVILAAAGGGITWYLMKQQSTMDATNTSTPTPEQSVSPTPAPTPEQANANTGNTSNSEVVTTTSPDNSNVNTAPSPEQTKTAITQQTPVTTKTVTTRPTQVTTNTPRTTTPKPTTKPETKPSVRGGIIPQ
jgi:serine/threonine protein kinase